MPDDSLTPASKMNGTNDPTMNQPNAPSSILHAKLTTQPPKIIKAEGNYLTTSTGTQIFDATGGAAVACIGHNHPKIKAAILKQLDTGVAYAYSPFFTTSAAENLAHHLTASTGGEMRKVFVVSSGTEAVEAALKIARQYFVEKEGLGTRRERFIAREGSYHGNTLGALGVGEHAARKAIYRPLLGGNVGWVSPCYPYRGMREGEGEAEYVERLKEELEEEFAKAGEGTVCAFVAETMSGLVSASILFSSELLVLTITDPRRRTPSKRLPKSHERSLRSPRRSLHPRRSHVWYGPYWHPPRLGTRRRCPTFTDCG